MNSKNDILAMKFLHYFITEKDYNPVIVHGIQNEIWLENMNNDVKIVRINLNYIHNEEQLNYDFLKTLKLVNQIKRKTFSLSMKTVTFYLDLNDDLDIKNTKNNIFVKVKKESDLKKDSNLKKIFPDIISKLKFTEKGEELFKKINNDIYNRNVIESQKIEKIFKEKKPIVTYTLIGIMTFLMILMYVIGNSALDVNTLYNFGALVKNREYYRLFTSIFLHIGVVHFLANAYSLKILGKKIEDFYGHVKMFIIFIFSGLIGNLLSLIFMNNSTIAAGASGSIFGLMGSMLYFAYTQRNYMAEALKRDIIPIIFINLFISFLVPSINLYAHLGGLVGGILISMALGINYRESKIDRINGLITSIILLVGLIFLVYIK